MGLRHYRFKGKVKIRGRPREQASAEIMVMKANSVLQERKQKRTFFIFLDILMVISFGSSIYSFFIGNLKLGFFSLIPGLLILIFFIWRNFLRKPSNKNKKKYQKKR
mgnify:FL=1